MTIEDTHEARAQRAFRSESARHEKGSAMALIGAEAKATEDKTARLKALRLQHEAQIVPEAPAPVRKRTKRAASL